MLAIVELSICYYSGELPSCRLSHDSLHEPLTYMITPPNLPLVIVASLILVITDSTLNRGLGYCSYLRTVNTGQSNWYGYARTCFTDDHYYVKE